MRQPLPRLERLQQKADSLPRKLCAMPIANATCKQPSVTEPSPMRPPPVMALVLAGFVALTCIPIGSAWAQDSSPGTPAIVVAIPFTAPESTEQDVATHYRLEPMDRRRSQVLQQRIVVYRIPDERTPADVLRQIDGDVRISSAQPNFAYTAPLPPPSDPVVASRRRDEKPAAKAARRAMAVARAEPDRRRASAPRMIPARGARPDVGPRAPPGEDAVPRASRSRLTLASNLAWPTADEPFIGAPRTR